MHVEQERLVGLDGVFERAAEILRFGHGQRLDAGGSRPGGEIRIERFFVGALVKHRSVFAAAEHAELDVADRDPAEIVPDHPHHRNVVFDRGAQHMRHHGEAAVAGDRDDGPIRRGEFCAERAGRAKAHAGKAPGVEHASAAAARSRTACTNYD